MPLRVTRPECNDQRYVEGKTEWASPMRVPIWRHPCRERDGGGKGKEERGGEVEDPIGRGCKGNGEEYFRRERSTLICTPYTYEALYPDAYLNGISHIIINDFFHYLSYFLKQNTGPPCRYVLGTVNALDTTWANITGRRTRRCLPPWVLPPWPWPPAPPSASPSACRAPPSAGRPPRSEPSPSPGQRSGPPGGSRSAAG